MSKKLLVLGSAAILTVASVSVVNKVKGNKKKEETTKEPERREKFRREQINPDIDYIKEHIIDIMNKEQRKKYENDLVMILKELEKPYCDLEKISILTSILKQNIRLDVTYGESMRTVYEDIFNESVKGSCIF